MDSGQSSNFSGVKGVSCSHTKSQPETPLTDGCESPYGFGDLFGIATVYLAVQQNQNQGGTEKKEENLQHSYEKGIIDPCSSMPASDHPTLVERATFIPPS